MTTQIGGTHYVAEYGHWDLAVDAGLGYDIGNCTKYLARAHKKGRAVEDLQKSLSYYDKWESRGTHREGSNESNGAVVERALDQYFIHNPTPVNAQLAIRAVVSRQRYVNVDARGLINACLQDAISNQCSSER